MLGMITHRGPDDSGFWHSDDGLVGLGHRRLAIIDLTSAGHQPMVSVDGRYAIVFNGEIYNYQELRSQLAAKGIKFISDSDTEVLLNLFAEFGPGCLGQLNGMFAFAIWDNQEKSLFAARDRLGEKPFKYYIDNERFIFASETKSILQCDGIDRTIDFQAIDTALSLRFVDAPDTGFKKIRKLPAGHYLLWQGGKLTVSPYWKIGDQEINFNKSSKEWKKEVWQLFLDSVSKRLVSDVPVGAFLSGGVDSTSVVAALKELGRNDINTFVISIAGESADQRFAAQAARYFGTTHHEISLGKIDYASALSDLASVYDEPFFDSSALPSMLISREMKKKVTVVLSGDGGDELFGGYDSYGFARLLAKYQFLPGFFYKKIVPSLLRLNNKLLYRAEVMSKDFYSAYADYYAVWQSDLPRSHRYLTKKDLWLPEWQRGLQDAAVALKFKEWFGDPRGADIANRAMRADLTGRLADGYLTKVDMASMLSAVEVRAPFLDHRLVELSQRMPSSFKLKGGKTKLIWKEIIKDKVPEQVINRSKAGFSIPLGEIMKSDLKEIIIGSIISPNSRVSRFFSDKTIKLMWNDHLAGRADYSNHLWSILMLELWLKNYQEK